MARTLFGGSLAGVAMSLVPDADLEEEVDPDALKPELLASARDDDAETLLRLLQAGVPPTFIDSSGWTALHWAAKNGNASMVRALLDAKASAPYHHMVKLSSKEDAEFRKVAENSISAGTRSLSETFQSLQRRAAEEEITDLSPALLKNTPLLWAAFKGHLYIVWMLLLDGYATTDVDDMGNTAVHLAASAGHVKVVEVLVNDGANCNAVNIYKNLPIDTCTHPFIREALLNAMTKNASMTSQEAAAKHQGNIKWVNCCRLLFDPNVAVQ